MFDRDYAYGLKVYAGRKLVQPLTKVQATTRERAQAIADSMKQSLVQDNVYGRAAVTVKVEPLPRARRSQY